jgi:t-SNARE complex subunit (syntaxin)
MSKNEDLAVQVAKVDESAKSAHKRIDKLEEITDTIYNLASDIKLLAQAVSNQQDAINKINANLETINSKPSKWVDLVKSTLISAFFGGLGAMILNSLLK